VLTRWFDSAPQAVYDGTGGPQWSFCSAYRTDPCACTEDPSHGYCAIYCKDGHITDIILNKNGMKGSIPASVSQMTGLTYINWGVNALNGTIPDAVRRSRA
jgi:hypothetical protein